MTASAGALLHKSDGWAQCLGVAPHVVNDLGLLSSQEDTVRGLRFFRVSAGSGARQTNALGYPASEGRTTARMARFLLRSSSIKLAAVFAFLFGRVLSLGASRIQGFSGSVPIGKLSWADAAIDSCVALATTGDYGLTGSHTSAAQATNKQGLLRDDSGGDLVADGTKESRITAPNGRTDAAALESATWWQNVILRRLGLTEMVRQGLQLPKGAKVDQADVLIDDDEASSIAQLAGEFLPCACTERAHPHVLAACSRACLEKAQAVFEEAQLFAAKGRFEEARLSYHDAILRVAAYSNKVEANMGFLRWGEGGQLDLGWVQLAVDIALGAADACMNLGCHADAVLECTTALALEPDNVQARYIRGLAYLLRASDVSLTYVRSIDVSPRRFSDRPRLLRQAWKDLWIAHSADPRHRHITEALDDCREAMRAEGTGPWVPKKRQAQPCRRWARQAQGGYPPERALTRPRTRSTADDVATCGWQDARDSGAKSSEEVEARAQELEASTINCSPVAEATSPDPEPTSAIPEDSRTREYSPQEHALHDPMLQSTVKEDAMEQDSPNQAMSVLQQLQKLIKRVGPSAGAAPGSIGSTSPEECAQVIDGIGSAACLEAHAQSEPGSAVCLEAHAQSEPGAECHEPEAQVHVDMLQQGEAGDVVEKSEGESPGVCPAEDIPQHDQTPDPAYTTFLARRTPVLSPAKVERSRMAQSIMKTGDLNTGEACVAPLVQPAVNMTTSEDEQSGEAPLDMPGARTTPGSLDDDMNEDCSLHNSEPCALSTAVVVDDSTNVGDQNRKRASPPDGPLTPLRASLMMFQKLRAQLHKNLDVAVPDPDGEKAAVTAGPAAEERKSAGEPKTDAMLDDEDQICQQDGNHQDTMASTAAAAAVAATLVAESDRRDLHQAIQWLDEAQAALAADGIAHEVTRREQDLPPKAATDGVGQGTDEKTGGFSWMQWKQEVVEERRVKAAMLQGDAGVEVPVANPSEAAVAEIDQGVVAHVMSPISADEASQADAEDDAVNFDSATGEFEMVNTEVKMQLIDSGPRTKHFASELTRQFLALLGSRLCNFCEQLPEILTPSHIFRPRKLRPEVVELVQQCAVTPQPKVDHGIQVPDMEGQL